MGMTVSKNTLCNWLKKGKKYLDELVCVLKSIALEKDSIVNCDETWCKCVNMITIRSATFVSSQKMAIDCNLYLRCEQKF